VKHTASTKFWETFDALPTDVQRVARKNFELLKSDSAHPSLHFKTIGAGNICSVRVGLFYRALGVAVLGGVQWFWIGTHAEYDRLIV
jgi:hypothetical protein